MRNPFILERMREQWHWISEDLARARATQILVGLLLLIHTGLWLAGPQILETAYVHFGLTRADQLKGHLWQLLSYGFLHAGFVHLLFNLLALLMAGLQLERIAGAKGVVQVFLAGVAAGGIAHVCLQPDAQANLTLVGASGGIAAMFFWLITLSPDDRSRFVPLSWRTLGRLFLAAQILLVASLWLPVAKAAAPNPNEAPPVQVGHACHLGGSLIGWLLARRALRPSQLSRREMEILRARREARLHKDSQG